MNAILNQVRDMTLVDDYPLDLSHVVSPMAQLKIFNSLLSFENAYSQSEINEKTLIIFDLHLEKGRLGLEALPQLKPYQTFLFMTSDHFNPELTTEAEKRGFVIIPKELLHFTSIRDAKEAKETSDFNTTLSLLSSSARL